MDVDVKDFQQRFIKDLKIRGYMYLSAAEIVERYQISTEDFLSNVKELKRYGVISESIKAGEVVGYKLRGVDIYRKLTRMKIWLSEKNLKKESRCRIKEQQY